MKQLMDEVRFVSMGREGKELHLVKYLEAGNITALLPEEELRPWEEARVEPAPVGEYVFRLMQPAEAIEVAKCVYKTYGYTYPGEHVYYPERLVELSRTGEQIPIVAISDRGEVIGYCAIFGGEPADPVRELGQAAVDPAHRGRQIVSQLIQFAINEARGRGLAGLCAEPVTNHVFSQQAAAKAGFRDTAILLGYVPESVYFKKIGTEALPQRETLLYSLLPLRPWEPARVYVPPQNRDLSGRIYENAGIERELVILSSAAAPGRSETDALGEQHPEHSLMSTRIQSAFDVARIEITAYGRHAVAEVESKLRELCRKGIACIHLDLLLNDPCTALLCADFEALGFLLAGVLPDPAGRDVLRLQYLNDVPIDFDRIHMISDVGQELLRHIRQATQG
jgi:serine/threonine-protein kinase RsbW